MTALRLEIEDITVGTPLPGQAHASLQKALDEIDRLATIITDLLVLARAGNLPGQNDSADLVTLAKRARQRWIVVARAHDRDLWLSGPAVPMLVSAACAPIEQILDVLIDNALKHGAGMIEISLVTVGDQARIRVTDQGRATGMSSPWPASAPTQGEGLGLPLAQDLAALMGGTLARVPSATTAYELVLPKHKALSDSRVVCPAGR